MAKYKLSLTPDLTKEKLFDVFSAAFGSTYKMELKPSIIFVNFGIVKSGWTGAAFAFKANEKEGTATLTINGYIPSFFLRFMFGGLIAVLILANGPWKKLLAEIDDFIKKSPDFSLIQ